MRIVIVGDGKVGYNLATHFSGDTKNDVVIIDKNMDALRKANDFLDVMCIKGNGLSSKVLKEAGVQQADIFIAATSTDESNMLCCLTARNLGARHTIARIRDPEYASEVASIKKELALDLIINPDYESAAEISRIIKFPPVASVDPFIGGRVELVGFTVNETDPITGDTLAQITGRFKAPVIFCAVEREQQVFIPNGDFIIKPGDVAYVIGETKGLLMFFKLMRRKTDKARTATIIGGSRIAVYLSKMLLDAGIRVRIIEIDDKKCMVLSELLPNVTIIHGDGLDEEVLASHGIGETDALITLTNLDEENLFAALYGAYLKITRVVAKSNRTNYNNVVKKLGIESIVSPKDITSDQILRYVRAMENTLDSEFETLYQIVEGQAEALCFTATEHTKFLNTPLKDLPFKKELLVATIVHERKIIIPTGDSVISAGDQVIVVTKNHSMFNLNQIIEELP